MHGIRKIFFILLFPFVLILLIAGSCGETPSAIDGEFTTDTILDKPSYKFDILNIPTGVTVSLAKDTVISIAGAATIDGKLASKAAKLTLDIAGDFVLNGEISVAGKPLAITSQADESETSFKNQVEGLYIIAKGKITTGQNSKINSITPMVLTDNAAELARTPKQVDEEANSATGNLPTFLPLPEDSQQIVSVNNSTISTLAATALTISGRWDFSARPGDKPIHIRFNGTAKDIVFDAWTLIPPVGVVGKDAKKDSAKDAKASNGKSGMNLNIYNNGGSISLDKTVINVPSGGDGGNAVAVCATATAGNGGKAGNFRMTAKNGINFGAGGVTINIGKAGNGGDATVTGNGECDVNAIAGKGADNKKKIFIRGQVAGLANLSLGDVKAGSGGNAIASTLLKAPSGQACGVAGKDGGDAKATAGNGADASFKTNTAQIAKPNVIGGDAGNASAKAGSGGDGGDCTTGGPGGKGGDGGKAIAKAGNGGKGSSSSGKAGDAAALGGTAGRGGHACGTPPDTGGKGGKGGDATATAGTAGNASTKGTSTGNAGDGGKGGDGKTPGAGGSKGIGSGSPTKLADGKDGLAGGPCPAPNKKTITVQKSGSGQGNVMPTPAATNQNGNNYSFPKDETVVFTATANSGSEFDSWSGCLSVAANKCTVKADSDKTIIVNFNQTNTSLKQAYIDFRAIPQGSIPDDSSYCLPLIDPQTEQVINDYSIWATFDWNPVNELGISTQSVRSGQFIQVLRQLTLVLVVFECTNQVPISQIRAVSLDSKAICNKNKCTELTAFDSKGDPIDRVTNNAPNTPEKISISSLLDVNLLLLRTFNIVEFLAKQGFEISFEVSNPL